MGAPEREGKIKKKEIEERGREEDEQSEVAYHTGKGSRRRDEVWRKGEEEEKGRVLHIKINTCSVGNLPVEAVK